MRVTFTKENKIQLISSSIKVISSIIIIILVLSLNFYDIFTFDLTILGISIILILPAIMYVILISATAVGVKLSPKNKITLKKTLHSLNDPRLKTLQDEYARYKTNPFLIIGFILSFLLSMLFEELVFRVLLFDIILRLSILDVFVSAIISSIAFGVAHLVTTRSPLVLISTTTIGFFLIILYIIGGFFLVLLIHVIWDAIIFLEIFTVFKILDRNNISIGVNFT